MNNFALLLFYCKLFFIYIVLVYHSLLFLIKVSTSFWEHNILKIKYYMLITTAITNKISLFYFFFTLLFITNKKNMYKFVLIQNYTDNIHKDYQKHKDRECRIKQWLLWVKFNICFFWKIKKIILQMTNFISLCSWLVRSKLPLVLVFTK